MVNGTACKTPTALTRRSQLTADSLKDQLKLRYPNILDHCPGGSILDPMPGSPPLIAAEARYSMREAIQDLAEVLPASEIQQLTGVLERRGLI